MISDGKTESNVSEWELNTKTKDGLDRNSNDRNEDDAPFRLFLHASFLFALRRDRKKKALRCARL
jgi:hypothetical protein